jgi:hypothetical protein
VKDSLTGNPIPYVNIWVEKGDLGTNSEIDGTFSLKATLDQKIIFSSLGYENKIIFGSTSDIILLHPKVYELNEVILEKRKGKNRVSYGDFSGLKLNSGVSNTGQDEVHIWGKLIQANEKIKKHPYLESIEFKTRSQLKNVVMRLRFYEINAEGIPLGDLIADEIIVSVKKGTNLNRIDLSLFHIKIPEEGIIIGFEYLKLEQNKLEYIYTAQGEKGKKKGFRYEPSILGFFPGGKNLMVLNKDGSLRRSYGTVELALKLNLID